MKRNKDIHKIIVNDQFTFEIGIQDLDELDVKQIGEVIHALHKNKAYEVHVGYVDRDSKEVELIINGQLFTIQIKDHLDLLIEDLGFNKEDNDLERFIHSPMPGLVLEVKVKQGERVQAGTPLLILEAMKMENVISSPSDAVIEEIHVSSTDSVSKGALLITLSPHKAD